MELAGELVVAAQGELCAQLQVERAAVAGRVQGDILARDELVIEAGATVRGRIKTPSLAIDPGAAVFGEIEMDVELPPEAIALRG